MFLMLAVSVIALAIVSAGCWVHVWALERRTAQELTEVYAHVDDVRELWGKQLEAVRTEFQEKLDKGFL